MRLGIHYSTSGSAAALLYLDPNQIGADDICYFAFQGENITAGGC